MITNTKDEIRIINQWDNDSLQLLYDDYFKALTFYADRILNSRVEAEDVVQDVFLSVWQAEKDFPSIAMLRSYLYHSVRNQCLNRLKKRKLETVRLEDTQIGHTNISDELGEDELQMEEAIRQVFQAIDALPANQRRVLMLAMQGNSTSEIAESMNIAVGTVKKHKARAIQKLRDQLMPEAFLFLTFFVQ